MQAGYETCTLRFVFTQPGSLRSDYFEEFLKYRSMKYFRDMLASMAGVDCTDRWHDIETSLEQGAITTQADYDKRVAFADASYYEMVDYLCSGMEKWELLYVDWG